MAILNWNEIRERAQGMTDPQLHYAIADCRKAIDCRMPDTPAHDPCKGQGYYADECTVYSAELKARHEGKACPTCRRKY